MPQINEYVIDYFNNTYPRYTRQEMENLVYYLNPIFSDIGIPATRKLLREAGISRVPQFVKTYNGDYLPRIFTTEVTIDDVPAICYSGDSRRLDRQDYTMVSMGYLSYWSRDRLNHYEDQDGLNQSIIDWINNGEECDECGALFINTRTHHTTCPSCRAANEAHTYSTRAEDVLGEIPSKEVRYGIELEYEQVTALQVKRTLFKHAIAKRDGSIDNGVEVVTLPAPMKLHKDKLKNFFQQVHTQAHSNTGMHVHIERSKLSEYQVGFILEFLNSEHLYPKLEKIAGRDFKTNHYCRQKPDMKMTWGLSYDKKLMRAGTDKYSTLNTSKGKTIEVRIFSSPESHLECSAKLEFIEGLVAFSSPYSVHVKSLKDKFQWDTFEAFMTTNKKHYPSFYAYYQGVI